MVKFGWFKKKQYLCMLKYFVKSRKEKYVW